MKIKMLKTEKGSIDGVQVKEYKAGEIYDIPLSLAIVFVDQLQIAVKVEAPEVVEAEEPDDVTGEEAEEIETPETVKPDVPEEVKADTPETVKPDVPEKTKTDTPEKPVAKKPSPSVKGKGPMDDMKRDKAKK